MSNKMVRDRWADNAKFIGIMLMLLGHNALANDKIFDFIYSFHMPLFFFISGYYANKKDELIKNYIIKNAKSLLLPYLIFYILTLPFGYLVIYLHPYNHPFDSWTEFILKPIIGIFTVETTSFAFHTNGPSWFFVALFWVKMIYYIPKKFHCSMNSILWSCTLCIAIYFLLKHHQISLYGRVDVAVMAYPIFAMGYIFKKNNIISRLINSPSYIKNLGVGFILLTLCYLCSRLNGHVEFSAAHAGYNVLLMYLNALIGIIGVINIAAIIPQNRYILLIGGGTGIILGLHSPIQQFVKELVAYVFNIPTNNYPFIIALIMVIIISIIFIPVIVFLEKILPNVFGKNKIYIR